MGDVHVAVVLLVDRHGRLLMQHRDGHAQVAPNMWALPGGRVEPGETPIEAAHRELLEETGLSVRRLEPFWSGPRPPEPSWPIPATIHSFCASTHARQEDVVLGEGQAMVFIEPDRTMDRELARSAALVVPRFLASPQYARLVARRRGNSAAL